jgi:putative DNA primase/helicase
MDTITCARGRWKEILPQFGIDPKFLTNRHGPCPLCGGKDRFRFDDLEGSGSYFCGQCGAGNGIILIRKLKGWDFATACRQIDKIIGTEARPLPVAKKSDSEKRRSDIELVINDARSPEIGSTCSMDGVIEHENQEPPTRRHALRLADPRAAR